MTTEQDLVNRMEAIKKNCFISPNPYYIKGQHPTEYNDLTAKINELKKINSGVPKP